MLRTSMLCEPVRPAVTHSPLSRRHSTVYATAPAAGFQAITIVVMAMP